MLWLKRNLFFAAGAGAAAVLLAVGIYYLLTSVRKSKELEGQLQEKRQTLDRLYKLDPFPNATNIVKAKASRDEVRRSIAGVQKFFAPVPFEKVSGLAFKTLLDNSIYELQKKAEQSSVHLPGKAYAFTFEEQKPLFQFAPGSFPGLPSQLAEIKVICGALFDAKINRLVNLRRARLTTDDSLGGTDYHNLSITTNAVTSVVSTPYEVTFHSFSSELAGVLENCYKSPHGLLVKALVVEPVSAQIQVAEAPPPAVVPPPVAFQPQPPTVTPPPRRGGKDEGPPPDLSRGPVGRPPPTAVPGRPPPFGPPATAAPAAVTGAGLQTVLNERLLKVTMLLSVLKPSK
jgi:hypothetical protein